VQPPVASSATVRPAGINLESAGTTLGKLYPSLMKRKRERTTHCSFRIPISQMDVLDDLVAKGAPSVNAIVVDFIANCLRDLEENRQARP
jgi:hypothetical protein